MDCLLCAYYTESGEEILTFDKKLNKMIEKSFYYLDKYNTNDDELHLVYVLIFIPKKITFSNCIYDNFKMIRNCLDYNEMVLEKYKEDQETN